MKRVRILGAWIVVWAVALGVRADSKERVQAQQGSTAPVQQIAATPDTKKADQKKPEAPPCKTVAEITAAAGVHAPDTKGKIQPASAAPAKPSAGTSGQKAETTPCESVEGSAQHANNLENVLRSMDEHAAKFGTAQADFSWTPYNAVINDMDTPDKGRVYFRRVGKETEMAATFRPPDDRQVVFVDGKVQVYQPKTKILDVYDASAHKDEVEGFLVLGFGSSGEDLKKTYEVKYLGKEEINGVQTAKLELVPLSEKIKKNFPRIDLWIDPHRGVSLRQQLFQTGGDYRLADYSNIRVNEPVPERAFKLKLSGATKTVTH